jgi:hypothetical protein
MNSQTVFSISIEVQPQACGGQNQEVWHYNQHRLISLSRVNAVIICLKKPFEAILKFVPIFHILVSPCTQQGDDLDQWW